MIKEIKEDDIAECVDVIRRSFYTVAEELGFTIDNAPRVCKINCVYLHRLFDTPIFRTKKCFRQYCE